MKYEVRASAARDLDDAASWYAEHALDPRVPIRFLLEIRAVFEAIADAPYAFPEVHRDVRRCRVLAFPAYSVFYRVHATSWSSRPCFTVDAGPWGRGTGGRATVSWPPPT